MRPLLVLAVLLLSAAPALAGPDLGTTYPPTVDGHEGAPPRDWVCWPEDVWEVKSFTYHLGDLKVSTGPAQVVIGRHETSALWAVLLPEKPGTITSKDTDTEAAKTILLRFHPSHVGDLFPRKTVKKQGEPSALAYARRMFHHKAPACWWGGRWPVVTWKGCLVVDVDTTEGKRRMFMLDLEKEEVRYEHAFATNPVPEPPDDRISKKDALAAFDGAWNAFDEKYAMFVLRPEVDWKKLRKLYRPMAAKAKTAWEAAAAIDLLTSHLRDLHVYVKVGDTWLPGFQRMRPLNANWKAGKRLLGTLHEEKGLAWGKTEDGIGYLAISNLPSLELAARVDEVLEELAGTWGLILDLRYNGGGDEPTAVKIAARFVDASRVYSVNQYRAGSKHDRLGRKLERRVAPRGPWRYESPVVTLFGRKTMSSAESFALMMAQCPQVVTMGDHTAGSSANPMLLDLPGNIVVRMPRWLDMDPDGNPIDEVGVAPDVQIDTKWGDFRSADPVLEAALKRLRETPEADRKPGKR